MFYINLFPFSVMSLGSLHLFELSLRWARQAGSGCWNHSLSPVVAMGLYRVSPTEVVPSVFWLKTKCFKNQDSRQMPHPDFCFPILLSTGFEQQSFTHQISPGASGNRATHFSAHFPHWYHPWLLVTASFFSKQPEFGQHRAFKSSINRYRLFSQVALPEAKAPHCARWPAVPSQSDTPARVGLWLRVLAGCLPVVQKCFPSLWNSPNFLSSCLQKT